MIIHIWSTLTAHQNKRLRFALATDTPLSARSCWSRSSSSNFLSNLWSRRGERVREVSSKQGSQHVWRLVWDGWGDHRWRHETVLSNFSDRCRITEHSVWDKTSGDTLNLQLHRTLNLVKTRCRSFRRSGAITISLALAKYHCMAGAYLSQSISACGRDEVPPVEGRGSFAAITLIAPQFVSRQRNTLAFGYSGIANPMSLDTAGKGTAPCFRWSQEPYTRPVTRGNYIAKDQQCTILFLSYRPLRCARGDRRVRNLVNCVRRNVACVRLHENISQSTHRNSRNAHDYSLF